MAHCSASELGTHFDMGNTGGMEGYEAAKVLASAEGDIPSEMARSGMLMRS